jgi:hypothetical protein
MSQSKLNLADLRPELSAAGREYQRQWDEDLRNQRRTFCEQIMIRRMDPAALCRHCQFFPKQYSPQWWKGKCESGIERVYALGVVCPSFDREPGTDDEGKTLDEYMPKLRNHCP